MWAIPAAMKEWDVKGSRVGSEHPSQIQASQFTNFGSERQSCCIIHSLLAHEDISNDGLSITLVSAQMEKDKEIYIPSETKLMCEEADSQKVADFILEFKQETLASTSVLN